jgi:hypothetical protein
MILPGQFDEITAVPEQLGAHGRENSPERFLFWATISVTRCSVEWTYRLLMSCSS